ncbi:MAG: chemotaxis protein CheD [Spirochaetota bacterium]
MNEFRSIDGTPTRYIGIGEYHVTDKPEKIVTVVGSCLAICMYAKNTPMAGMLHAMLPHCNHHASTNYGGAHQANCVTFLFYMMLEKFKNAGLSNDDIEIKVFGGASTMGRNSGTVSVGKRNAEVFEIIIAREMMPVRARDLGGTQGRKVILDAATGDAFVKMLSKGARELAESKVVID